MGAIGTIGNVNACIFGGFFFRVKPSQGKKILLCARDLIGVVSGAFTLREGREHPKYPHAHTFFGIQVRPRSGAAQIIEIDVHGRVVGSIFRAVDRVRCHYLEGRPK